jgi:hypothetical protein
LREMGGKTMRERRSQSQRPWRITVSAANSRLGNLTRCKPAQPRISYALDGADALGLRDLHSLANITMHGGLAC